MSARYLQLSLLIFTAMTVFVVTACTAVRSSLPEPGSAPETATPFASEAAPNFTLPQLTGEPLALADLRGRWVLVNFWATWCVPCREEMPYLDRLAAEQAELLAVLAVNMREPESVVSAFAEELGLNLPILLQPDDAMVLAYGVRGLPLSVLVAPDGMLARRIVGPVVPGDVEAILLEAGAVKR